MERDIKALVAQMTLEEKAGMCSGKDAWRLKSVERLGIPEVMLSDGPHGLRKQRSEDVGNDDSIEAVCFPTACATACSFDRQLMTTLGQALGDECQAENVSVILGPAANIKRTPLCGRNFEYISEDPYLTGQIAAAHIKGVQSKNAGTSLKHYAANNQEYHRLTVSAEIDERTLREIYLTGFEIAVKEAKPWTLMCCYNKVNGVYGSENKYLLTDILRDEWGFDGYVMSDWGAVNDRVKGLQAGLDLEMPNSGNETDAQIVAAVRAGTLDEKVLDTAVERMLRIIFRYADNRIAAGAAQPPLGAFGAAGQAPGAPLYGQGLAQGAPAAAQSAPSFDMQAHHALAARIEAESAVLLKNDGGLLPLPEGCGVAFIGQFAEKPRFQGGGSSHINCFTSTSAVAAAAAIPGVSYVPGFPADRDEENPAWLAEAVAAATRAQVAVIFAGLPDVFESEGYDRDHMRLPDCQNRLIDAVCAAQPNTVVVLHNGSPVEMPWAGKVKAILELYLGGQAVGQAAVDLLYGRQNPSGKLAETFPLKLADTPAYTSYPGNGDKAWYSEGVFVGYRWYDARQMDVLFPFGHGLSYTTFAYSNLRADKAAMQDTDTLTVQVDVTNTGARPGQEVVQLYVCPPKGELPRPTLELKGFEKLALNPGETKTATFVLDKRSFAYYNEGIADWYAPTGRYQVCAAASSRDIRLAQVVDITCTTPPLKKVDQNTRVKDLLADPRTAPTVADLLEKSKAARTTNQGTDAAREAITQEMVDRGNREAPLRAVRRYMGLTTAERDGIITRLNALIG